MQLPPLTRRQRYSTLLAGAGALSLSTAVAIGFWLFTAYQANEEKEALKVQAMQAQTDVILQVHQIVTEFKRGQDSTLAVALKAFQSSQQNGEAIHQTKVAAEQAVKKTEVLGRRLRQQQRENSRGKSIPTPSKVDVKKDSPDWWQRVLDRLHMSTVISSPAMLPVTLPLIREDSASYARCKHIYPNEQE